MRVTRLQDENAPPPGSHVKPPSQLTVVALTALALIAFAGN